MMLNVFRNCCLQEQGLALQEPPTDPFTLSDFSEGALTTVLTQVFGHEAFRCSQLAVIQCLLQGQSALAIMPTGTAGSFTKGRLVAEQSITLKAQVDCLSCNSCLPEILTSCRNWQIHLLSTSSCHSAWHSLSNISSAGSHEGSACEAAQVSPSCHAFFQPTSK
jgi:hypothetical protein